MLAQRTNWPTWQRHSADRVLEQLKTELEQLRNPLRRGREAKPFYDWHTRPLPYDLPLPALPMRTHIRVQNRVTMLWDQRRVIISMRRNRDCFVEMTSGRIHRPLLTQESEKKRLRTFRSVDPPSLSSGKSQFLRFPRRHCEIPPPA